MGEQAKAAQRLYDALAARDPAAILDALHEDFVGAVSAGMPLGVGGRHDGRRAMLERVWGKVFAHYEISVEPEELLVSGDDRVTAVGRYRGVERATGRPVDAVFAHVLTVRDGRVAELKQVTDTRSW
jgi:uncharacterized protein